MDVRAPHLPHISLLKDLALARPIIDQGGAVHFVGIGPSVEEQPKTPRAGPSISQSSEPAVAGRRPTCC